MRPSIEDVQASPDHVLIPGAKKLTAKQKRFARQLAMGATKADAYRAAYEVTSPYSMTKDPYQLAKHPLVAHEVQAIQKALEAQTYQTPAALRALVIDSLVKVITNPDSKPGQITAAAKVLGTVTEVAAFTARSEQKIITSSEDARARVLEQLRSIVKAEATDAELIERDAESLLAELAPADPHRVGTPQSVDGSPEQNTHTIPHEQSPSEPSFENSDPEDPHPSV